MKTILLITNKESGEVQPFATLTPFFMQHPEYKEKYSQIVTALSRKQTAFKDEKLKIERKKIIR